MADANTIFGFDAVGVTVVECKNNGDPIIVIDDRDPAPARNDRLHYDRMIRAMCSEFRARYRR